MLQEIFQWTKPIHKSKHAAKPGEGKLRFGKDTGLRKLKRAMRRGRVPDDVQFKIDTAQSLARFTYANRA